MKNKATLIFLSFLCGIIFFQFIFYKCESGRSENELALKQAQIDACLNAPVVVKVDTIRDTLPRVIHIPIIKYGVVERIIASKDTVIETREYSGVYTHPQFELHWSANVTGQLNDLTIKPPSLIKSLIITKEKTVDLTQYNTEKPKEKSHLYTTFGAGVSGRQLNSVDAGLMYIRKEGWGIQATIGTDFTNMIYRGGVVIRLK